MTEGPWCFSERAFIDHYNLRYLFDCVAEDESVDVERVCRMRDELKANLDEAARFGINTYVIFSRSFELMSAYDFLAQEIFPEGSPARKRITFLQSVLDDVIDHGKALGLRMAFHTNQMELPPQVYQSIGEEVRGSAPVCPGRERTWEIFRGKLGEFLDRFPGIDILQLTTSETQVGITKCDCEHCHTMTANDRFLRMVQEARDQCHAHHVEFQIRTWGELDDFAAYREFASSLPDGIVVSTKNTDGDFHLPCGPNPLIGFGEAEQLVEFDLWGEYRGWNTFPVWTGPLLAERLRYCREHGIDRVHVRVNWNPGINRLFDVPWGNIVNAYTFMRLCRNPYEDPDVILHDWIRETFGEGREEDLARFYRNTLTVMRASWYFLEGQAGSHSCIVYNRNVNQDYVTRIRNHCGERMADLITAHPQLASEREQLLLRLWDKTFGEIEGLEGTMPEEWRGAMMHGAKCTRFLALVNTECFKLHAAMTSGERNCYDIEAVGGRIEELIREWRKHDERHFFRADGPSAWGILAEARAKRDGKPVPGPHSSRNYHEQYPADCFVRT